jgi:hypothetical protein
VPDWVTAFGTLAAFAVALRLLAKELAARREQEEDRRRAQAHLVSVWPEYKGHEDPCLPWYVVVKNGNEEPVYEVRAHGG